MRWWTVERDSAHEHTEHVIGGGHAFARPKFLTGRDERSLPLDPVRTELVLARVLDFESSAPFGFLPQLDMYLPKTLLSEG